MEVHTSFPFFVIFALLLNEIRCGKFRKYVQIISYMPHFLSWVVIAGIWISMLSVSGGAVNQIMGWSRTRRGRFYDE